MKRLNILLVMIIVLILCQVYIVNADLGTFKQFQPISIRVLSNCSSVNLVEVTNSNTTFNISSPMSKISGQTFFYTFTNTSQIDLYSYSWNDPCVDCSQGNCGNSFSITATGQVMSSAKATIYLWIFIIALLIFIGLLIVGIFLPMKNKTDQMTGYIIAVENLKYLKIFSLIFSYLIGLFIAFFSYSICYSYLDFPFLTTLTYFLFFGLAVGTLVFFPLMIYFLIANWVRDSKINELLSRGLKTR